MVRAFLLISVLTLSGPVLHGAYAAETVRGARVPAVSEEDARKAALDKLEGGKIVKSSLEYKKKGRAVYDFVIVNDTNRVKVEIDADTGEMLKFVRKDIEKIDIPFQLREKVGAGTTPITLNQAKAIAIEKSGGGDVTKIEKEFKKDGRILYEVEVISANGEHELEIDAHTGAILEYSEKRFKNSGLRMKWEDDD